MVTQTNLYVQQKNRKGDPVTKDELLIFLGVNILMGIKKLPSYRDYWSSNEKLNDPYISRLMPVVRFGYILGNIHLADNEQEPEKQHKNYDKLYKLRPMINTLNKNFANSWNPGKYQ